MPYAPASRRPIADLFRATARHTTAFCVRRRIHPDAISYASILAAALAAGCFLLAHRYPLLLLLAPPLMLLRLYFNMLDGMVALAANIASPRGEILNDLPDRVSDILIFASLAHSGIANPALAYWTTIAAVMTAYVGTLGQAVAGRREFAGVMSKPWRMALLSVAAVAQYLIRPHHYAGYTALDLANLIILLGCLETCATRLRNTFSLLRSRNPQNSIH